MAQRPRGELRIIGGHWRSRRIRFALRIQPVDATH
jgi:hypothetical protein